MKRLNDGIKNVISIWSKPKNQLESKVVPNINLDVTKKQKKVLITYLDLLEASRQIEIGVHNKSGTAHTNRFELFQIIQAFIRLDFCIDVCSCNDEKLGVELNFNKYDVIFGLGNIFRCSQGKSSAYKILYLTENPYYVSYEREMERLKYFEERHNKTVPIYRSGMFFKDKDEEMADAVICLGEEKWFDNKAKKVRRIFPTAFKNEKAIDYSKRSKNNFLVFGTDGIIHKGIDLLVDVFEKHSDWNLYLCGCNVMENLESIGYKKLTDNIYDCGYINVNDDEFLRLAERCSFIVLPSCSEACSTGVLTGMRHGLIPVVMHGNGCDVFGEYCEFFSGYQLEQIEETLERITLYSDEYLKERYDTIREFADGTFSLEHFTMDFENALISILEEIK